MKRKKILFVAIVGFASGCTGYDVVSPNWRVSPDVLTFTASSQVVPSPYLRDHPPVVEATITITNNQTQAIVFNYSRDICDGLEIRAFPSADLSGTPVWSMSNAGIECAAVGYGPIRLEPGRSVNIVAYASVADVLGAGRPGGMYYFETVVFVGGGYVRGSSVHVPLGAVLLTR